MSDKFRELTFTNNVLAAQRDAYGASQPVVEVADGDRLSDDEVEFISSRDSFYMATVSETGWPYVQHRGGPKGFLRVLDESTIAFADLGGNRQLITTGNLASNDRVALFLMDYAARRRLKILGTASVLDAREHADLAKTMGGVNAKRVERIVAIRVAGFDWNCPQHITPRFTEAEVRSLVAPLKQRIAELEEQVSTRGGANADPATS